MSCELLQHAKISSIGNVRPAAVAVSFPLEKHRKWRDLVPAKIHGDGVRQVAV